MRRTNADTWTRGGDVALSSAEMISMNVEDGILLNGEQGWGV